jgi:beta-galactosidase
MWYDWCRFNQWRVTDFFKFISDEIHKYDPDARCHMRISVGGVNFLEAPTNTYTALHGGIDREALVKMYEVNGLDNFMQPAGGRIDPQLRYYDGYDENSYSIRWLGHTILLDFIRSLGPDKLIYDSEWHSVSSVYCVNPEPPAGYMHTALWLSALHGLGATKTWYWSRNANGSPGRSQEEYYGSLLIQPRLLNEYGVGLVELNTFSKEVVALERTPKQIYLLYSQPSAIHSPLYLKNQILTYEALQFTGLSTGFITENDLKSPGLPSQCKWLIIPDDSHVCQSTLDWLRNYVQEGGKLLVTGKNALKYNEYGKAYSSSQLEFLSQVDRLDIADPRLLLVKIEELMNKTEVKRHIQCIDAATPKQTAFGVMCRSGEYEGSHLVCLINLSSSAKEVSIELDGNTVNKAKNLFNNKIESVKTIKIEPLATMLFQFSK